MNAKLEDKLIIESINGYVKHIYIDFEGEGKSTTSRLVKCPTLLGFLCSDLATEKKVKFHVRFFDETLRPLVNAASLPAERKVCTFTEAIAEIVELAEERGCRIVAFSQHELEMVKCFCEDSQLVSRFEAVYWNIKLPAQRLRWRYRRAKYGNSLNEIMQSLAPKHKCPPPPKCGAAEACRRLRRYSKKRWSKWTDAQKQLAKELLAYNCGDCKAVHRLTNKVVYGLGRSKKTKPKS